MKRLALIVQRYEGNIVGGSEKHAAYYAKILGRAYDVDILTSCATETDYWENKLAPGPFQSDGIKGIRFAVTSGRTESWHRTHDLLLDTYLNARLQAESSEGLKSGWVPRVMWPISLQEEWIRTQGPHSEDLLSYLAENANTYDGFIFFTYLYSPTYFGSMCVPKEKSLFVPTLHDEAPAYLSVNAFLAQRMSRVLWNAQAERELGERLWGPLPGRIVALGFDVSEKVLPSREDYVFYCGRVDAGKGMQRLFDDFARYKAETRSSLKLVLAGSKQMRIPNRSDIEFLGHISDEEKNKRMQHARAFVMPSAQESLSMSTLESMANGTPVVCFSENPVLRMHMDKSGAGFLYSDYPSFKETISLLEQNPSLSEAKGILGQKYIRENYSTEKVYAILREEIESLGKQ